MPSLRTSLHACASSHKVMRQRAPPQSSQVLPPAPAAANGSAAAPPDAQGAAKGDAPFVATLSLSYLSSSERMGTAHVSCVAGCQ